MAGVKQLIDVDWSVGVTTASSQANQVLRPFVKLRLTLEGAEGGEREVKVVEMDPQQVATLLKECHKIQDSFDQLKE